MSVLEVDSIFKEFGNHRLLSDIWLKCETGDIIGIFGRNGSGKSTLLRIIFGTEPASAKYIRINGKTILKPYKQKDTIAFLPQHPYLPKFLKVKKVISMLLDDNIAESLKSDRLLIKVLEQRVRDISEGERQYLEIRILLSSNAQFILLDEPFKGISPLMAESVEELILNSSTEKGIILTDHNYRNVLNICTSACLLSDGYLKAVDKDKPF